MNAWPADQKAVTYATQNKHKETNVHALGKIRTCDPRNKATVYLRLALKPTVIGANLIYKIQKAGK